MLDTMKKFYVQFSRASIALLLLYRVILSASRIRLNGDSHLIAKQLGVVAGNVIVLSVVVLQVVRLLRITVNNPLAKGVLRISSVISLMLLVLVSIRHIQSVSINLLWVLYCCAIAFVAPIVILDFKSRNH